MATLAEFRAQYPQYDSVPDLALADSLHEKFYSKIPKIEFYKTIGLGSAAAIPGAEGVVTGVKQPEVSMRDRIMGTIETPFALGATLAGGAIAPIVGIAGTLASGKYGTQEGIRAGEEAIKAVQYQPRTQTAREALGAVGEFLQPVTSALPPTLGSTGATLNALVPAAATQANALARPAIRQATAPIQNALTSMMTREQQPSMVGMGAASTGEDLLRQQRLDQFGIRAKLGERTKNLQQQQFESEVERGVITGISEEAKTQLQEQMKLFEAGKQKDIIRNFERMTSEVGAEIADPENIRAVGKLVDKALNDEYTKKYNAYKSLYAQADNAGETLQQVPYQSLLDFIETKSATRREKLDPILNDVAESLKMNDPQGTGTISVRALEDIYQQIGTVKDSASAKPMKNIITQMGEGAGGELYQKARAARAQLAKEFEDVRRVDKLLGTKAGYVDRQVALDDVFKYVVLDGSLEEMRTVTKLLKKGGKEGEQAYAELKGQTIQHMKDMLTKGNQLSFRNLNTLINELDAEEKLTYMFGKKGRNEIMDLRDAIKDVLVKEPGAVNYSNTSGAVLRGLEALQALRFPGAKPAAEAVRTMEVKSKVKEALKQPNTMAPAQTNKNALANKPVKIDLKGMAE
jgi:Ca2+-binding EF-hand superfamily protein